MWLGPRLFLLVLAGLLAANRPSWAASLAASNEVVLIEDGWRGLPPPILQKRADCLARLVSRGLGGAKPSLVGRWFTEVESGLAHIAKTRPRFALLSPHAFARVFARQKVEVVAHSVGAWGDKVIPRILARRDS